MFIRNYLPQSISSALWGNRKRWGLTINQSDMCWQEWQRTYSKFYTENQRQGIGTRVNDSGYNVMNKIDLTGKRVLEIGAGDIRHTDYWQGMPSEYILADISPEMLNKAKLRLKEKEVPYRSFLLKRSGVLPVDDASIDVVVSFYSLEHLYPLEPYLTEISRVLCSGGILIGAIPAEGGLAWGLGRAITSRRWFKKNTTIDPDKIICWEHPNFADDVIIDLEHQFERINVTYWPLRAPLLDINLIIRFIYKKKLIHES